MYNKKSKFLTKQPSTRLMTKKKKNEPAQRIILCNGRKSQKDVELEGSIFWWKGEKESRSVVVVVICEFRRRSQNPRFSLSHSESVDENGCPKAVMLPIRWPGESGAQGSNNKQTCGHIFGGKSYIVFSGAIYSAHRPEVLTPVTNHPFLPWEKKCEPMGVLN